MNLEEYQGYVASFNNRDYDGFMRFFAEDVALEQVGHALRGKEGIRSFYGFFHDAVVETAEILRFFPGEDADFAQLKINFRGVKPLTQAMLDERGCGYMTPVPEGADFDLEFFIVYERNDSGLIHRIKCTVFEPVI